MGRGTKLSAGSAKVKMVVISDTHLKKSGERLPREVKVVAATADLIVDCGGFEAPLPPRSSISSIW